MKSVLVFVVAVVGTLTLGQSTLNAQVKAPSDGEVIREVRQSFNESIANHDAASIANYLDSDYQITTGSGNHYRETPEEDVQAWTEIFKSNPDIVYVRTTETVEVSNVNDLAAENGRWVGRWTSENGNVEMGGSYFAQWRNVSGEWKIRSEIFVTLYCKGPGCE